MMVGFVMNSIGIVLMPGLVRRERRFALAILKT
jgi:hypothetical protein